MPRAPSARNVYQRDASASQHDDGDVGDRHSHARARWVRGPPRRGGTRKRDARDGDGDDGDGDDDSDDDDGGGGRGCESLIVDWN